MKIMNKKNVLLAFLLCSSLLLQGCSGLSSSEEPLNGVLTGTLSQYPNSRLVAKSGNTETAGKTDAEGHFLLSLKSGVYNLYARDLRGDKLILIKSGVQIENNIAVTLIDAELVPIPMVVSVAVKLIFSDSAVIEWETDIESDGYIEYGFTELYGCSTYASTEKTLLHRVQIHGLKPSTTYHFRVAASRNNLEATRSLSSDYSFVTKP